MSLFLSPIDPDRGRELHDILLLRDSVAFILINMAIALSTLKEATQEEDGVMNLSCLRI